MAKENYLRTFIIVVVIIGLGWLVYSLYNQNIQNNMLGSENMQENYESMDYSMKEKNMMNDNMKNNEMMGDEMMSEEGMENFQNSDPNNSMDYLNADQNFEEARKESSFPKEQLNADDLLPKDDSTLWAQVNPSGEGSLKDRNFLQSGYHIGINTVGQTLRNANMQLRSDPPNPQVKVSPWLQTTIEPDLGRKPLEIGGCA